MRHSVSRRAIPALANRTCSVSQLDDWQYYYWNTYTEIVTYLVPTINKQLTVLLLYSKSFNPKNNPQYVYYYSLNMISVYIIWNWISDKSRELFKAILLEDSRARIWTQVIHFTLFFPLCTFHDRDGDRPSGILWGDMDREVYIITSRSIEI